MADTANTNTTDSANVNGANLAQVIAQAVQAGVETSLTSSLGQILERLNSLSESIKKQSDNDDRGFSTELSGTYDMYENTRRSDVARDRIQVQAEIALANAVELAKGIGIRSLDHFGSLPPINKPATGC
jgi:hypothetical protein